MVGLAILLGFNLLGVILKLLLHIPLPGNVIGLILFTISLFLKIIKIEWVEESAQFLLNHMMIFFAPFIVSALVIFPLIGEHWLSVVVNLFVSTCVVLVITGWVANLLNGEEDKQSEHG